MPQNNEYLAPGAFRTYPKGFKPPDEEASEYQTIPLNKIEDFGVHCKQYYSLDVSYFKSTMDKVNRTSGGRLLRTFNKL